MLPDHLPEFARQRPRIDDRRRSTGRLSRRLLSPLWRLLGASLRLIKYGLAPTFVAFASASP